MGVGLGKLARSNMKVTLSICTNRQVKPKTTGSLLEMVNYSKDVDFHIVIAERGFTIAENRIYSVVQAQKNESDYLLFVDDDMTFPEDTLERLLEHKKEVIGVDSYSRCLPPSSTVGKMNDKGEYMHPDKHTPFEMKIPNELFKAYFVGAGVMLIDMEVFKKIPKPYFQFDINNEGQIVNGEDGTFCEKVKKAGYDVWCDPTIPIGHIGDYEYKKGDDNLLFRDK